MGDRCRIEITMLERDREKFTSEMCKAAGSHWEPDDLFDEIDTVDGVTSCICYEANYGWYDQLQKVAASGCVFEGQHFEGGDYGAYCFNSFDGAISYCMLHTDTKVVPVDGDNGDYERFDTAEKLVTEYFRENNNDRQ